MRQATVTHMSAALVLPGALNYFEPTPLKYLNAFMVIVTIT